ncbi:MAG: hypothetical protein ABW133_18405 [Polyangiaceae bacterium]
MALLGLSARPSWADPLKTNHAPPTAGASAEGNQGMGLDGDGLSRFKINDSDPEKSVPSNKERDGDPLQFGYHLMDLAEKGGVAAKKGDHRAAVKYFAALAKAVPDRSISFTKMCTSYEALGEWDHAVEACRSALGLEGVTVADSVHFVNLMLAKKGALTAAQVEDVASVVDHLRSDPSTRAVADDLDCDIGLRLEDVKRLETCATALAAIAPDGPRTLSHQWALAIVRKDYAEARNVIARAKNTEMPAAGIEQMEAATAAAEPPLRKVLGDWRATTGASVVLAALLGLFVVRRRSLTPARS